MADTHLGAFQEQLKCAIDDAVVALPRTVRGYAHEVALATLAGARTAGQAIPQPPPTLNPVAADQAIRTVDVACDRARTAQVNASLTERRLTKRRPRSRRRQRLRRTGP